MRVSDPRGAELEEMLAALDPRTELVYRLALMGISEHCRGDRFFDRRTYALQMQLRLDVGTLALVIAEARQLEDQVAEELKA